ncbi:nitroreductase family protein [Limosilactobacillus reuteri]|uniref:nitroreductase family protein n=1 Tax=Limosilactobacillus reuteri TaxID=1598 RepID=UPI000F026537|nr:nitroreductase family protein [Limosilactobacillus reuteri]RMX26171.1 hypothetical protein C6H63_08545 [Limosilactobacillus reuteri]
MNDKRYWIQKNDNYELFQEQLRKEAQNYPGWLSYFAPHKDYQMKYEKKSDSHKSVSFWNITINKRLDLSEALLTRASIPINRLVHKWTEDEILFFLKMSISAGNRVRKNGSNSGENIPLRNYPSGGAEYPITPYLVFNKNIGRFKKDHAYKVHGDIGELTDQGENSLSFSDIFAIAQFNKKLSKQMNTVSFAVVFEMNLRLSFVKYRSFARNLALIEAGHIGQNIQLVTTAMEKASICTGGVLNDKARKLLNIKDKDSFIIYGIFIG